uniref:Uncharacterized protein n=1 Tax=Anguilla anguilla TaxID=7936 RepID=A0A0E9XK04_ANGAN
MTCAKHSKPHLQIIMLVVNQKSTCGTNIQLTHTGGGRRETFSMNIWIMWNKSTPWACLDNTPPKIRHTQTITRSQGFPIL